MKEKHFYLLTIDSRHQLYSYHIRIHIIYRYISGCTLAATPCKGQAIKVCTQYYIYTHHCITHLYLMAKLFL